MRANARRSRKSQVRDSGHGRITITLSSPDGNSAVQLDGLVRSVEGRPPELLVRNFADAHDLVRVPAVTLYRWFGGPNIARMRLKELFKAARAADGLGLEPVASGTRNNPRSRSRRNVTASRRRY